MSVNKKAMRSFILFKKNNWVYCFLHKLHQKSFTFSHHGVYLYSIFSTSLNCITLTLTVIGLEPDICSYDYSGGQPASTGSISFFLLGKLPWSEFASLKKRLKYILPEFKTHICKAWESLNWLFCLDELNWILQQGIFFTLTELATNGEQSTTSFSANPTLTD